MLKILHIEHNAYPIAAKNIIESLGSVDHCNCNTQEEFLEMLGKDNYEVLFIRLGISLDQKALDIGKSLQYIVTPTTGLNHLDLEAIQRKKISVVSLKGEIDFLNQVYSTAEYTWALLLSVTRFIPGAFQHVLEGNWQRDRWIGQELADSTLGIIGYGRIGKMIARYGLAFRMKVIVYDINPEIVLEDESIHRAESVEELLSHSHVVSLHIPMTKETHSFFSEKFFHLMPEGTVFINTSRGELVDERALLECLENGHLSAAALDVLDGDSCWGSNVAAMHPLLKYAKDHNNLIITPHIAGYAKNSIYKTRFFVTEKLVRLIREQNNNEK